MIYAINQQKLEACDFLLEYQELEKIGVLDRKGIEKAYQIGYEYASKKLDELIKKQKSGPPPTAQALAPRRVKE